MNDSDEQKAIKARLQEAKSELFGDGVSQRWANIYYVDVDNLLADIDALKLREICLEKQKTTLTAALVALHGHFMAMDSILPGDNHAKMANNIATILQTVDHQNNLTLSELEQLPE